MGTVYLPSVDDIMNIKEPNERMEQLINTLGILMKNLKEINGYLSNSNIRAKSIKAEKMDVDQLSAISADIGEVTAGIIRGVEIYGSYIATREGTYPRAEQNDEDDLFAAYQDANNYVAVAASIGGVPGVFFTAAGNTALSVVVSGGAANLFSDAMPLQIGTNINGDIYLLPQVGYRTIVRGWDEVMTSGGQTLQDVIDDLQSQINNKADKGASTGSAGGGNGGIPIGATWTTSAGPVSWAGIGSHSHNQT